MTTGSIVEQSTANQISDVVQHIARPNYEVRRSPPTMLHLIPVSSVNPGKVLPFNAKS